MRERRSEVFHHSSALVLLAALLAFAAWTRWPFVGEGLWRDEAIAVYVSQSSTVPQFLKRSRIADYNPPLFNVLLAVWGRGVGYGEMPLKGFAFAWGLLAVLSVGIATKRIFRSTLAALVACAFAINNPILIGVSSELRAYSLSVVLAMLSVTLAIEIYRTPPGGTALARMGLLAASILLAYSHVAGGLVVAAVGICGLLAALLGGAKRSAASALVTAAAVAAVSYLWWLPTSWRHYRVGLPYEMPISPGGRWRLLFGQFDDILPLWLPILMTFVLAVGMERFGGSPRRTDWRLNEELFPVLVLLAAAAAVLFPLGLFSQTRRYIVIAAALLTVLAGAAVAGAWNAARRRSALVRIAVGIAILFLVFGSCIMRAPRYREMRELMAGGVPKSGIRTLCRDRKIGNKVLVIAAPDYLASTVWYYCRSEERIRGFATWENPTLVDLRGYSQRWSSPSAPAQTVDAVERFLAQRRQGSFFLVWDRHSDGPPLFYLRRVTAFKRVLEERYSTAAAGLYDGRLEKIGFAKLRDGRPTDRSGVPRKAALRGSVPR